MSRQLYTCLWIGPKAKEAADFYCTVFKNSKVTSDNPMVVSFDLNGKRFIAIKEKPPVNVKFSDSISFVIDCDTQEEIDFYWEKLTMGGKEVQCGWLVDKYGISWQVVPTILPKLLSDPKKAPKVVEAFMKMKKIDIEALKNA
jgi:predicted 3-demethylubiquinone-9 3-methyltransferase (glyoxalase superfamily)